VTPDAGRLAFVTSHLVVGAVPSVVSGAVRPDRGCVGGGLRAAGRARPWSCQMAGSAVAEAILTALGSSPEHTPFSIRYAQGLLPGMQPLT